MKFLERLPLSLVQGWNFLLLVALYYLNSSGMFAAVCCAIVLVMLFRDSPIVTIQILTVVSYLFFPRALYDFRGGGQEDLLDVWLWNFHGGLEVGFWAKLLCRLLALAVLLGFCYKMRKKVFEPLTGIVVAFAAIFSLLSLAAVFVPIQPAVAIALATLGAFISRGFLSYFYFQQVYPVEAKSWTEYLWVTPFWQSDYIHFEPRPMSLSARDKSAILWVAPRLLALALFFALTELLLRTPWMRASSGQGLTMILLRESNWLQVWLMVLTSPIIFIVRALWLGGAVGPYLLANLGYRFPDPFRNPFPAKSFVDFFSRMFVYYNRILVMLVYIPLYKRLYFLKNFRRLRTGLTLFLSAFLFSLIYHSARDYQYLLSDGVWAGLQISIGQYLLYSFFLAIVLTLSFLYEEKYFSWLWQPLRLFGFLVLYGVLMQLAPRPGESYEGIYIFLKFLATGINDLRP